MKILVCCKFIRDDNELTVNPDRSINVDSAPWMISSYDLNAIEAAMKLSSSVEGSTVEVISAAGEVLDNTKMRKAVLSRGPSKLYGVKVEECGDLYSTAALLSRAIQRAGGADLVVCGEGSGDMYTQTLGNMLAAFLDVPALNAVDYLAWEDDSVIARRVGDSRTETYRLNGPAVVSVTSDICRTHIPSMKDILAAGKKPVEIWEGSELSEQPAVSQTLSILAPERAERSQVVFRAGDEGGVEAFARAIKKYL